MGSRRFFVALDYLLWMQTTRFLNTDCFVAGSLHLTSIQTVDTNGWYFLKLSKLLNRKKAKRSHRCACKDITFTDCSTFSYDCSGLHHHTI